jgi:hypothetical protein
MIERSRRTDHPDLARVVVAIDPAASSHEGSDETGIIVAGRDDRGHGYVLADLSGKYQPHDWAKIAITAYRQHGADRIVAEVNNGGEMVEATLRTIDANVPFTAVHASRGKFARAEPVSALYEQNRCHHVGVPFERLEEQLTSFTPDMDRGKSGSPDRADAMIWAFHDLLVAREPYAGLFEWYQNALPAPRAQTPADAEDDAYPHPGAIIAPSAPASAQGCPGASAPSSSSPTDPSCISRPVPESASNPTALARSSWTAPTPTTSRTCCVRAAASESKHWVEANNFPFGSSAKFIEVQVNRNLPAIKPRFR